MRSELWLELNAHSAILELQPDVILQFNMNARVQALIDQARIMTAEERLAALDALQELVALPDQAWEDAWARESEARIAAFQRGEIEAEDFDSVMEQMRREYLDKH